MIIGIDIVFLHTRNHIELARWYQEKLGLDIGFHTEDHSWQEFAFSRFPPPTRFAIEGTGTSPSKIEEQSIMVSFSVEGIRHCVDELEQKGIEFYGESKIKAEGSSLFATLRNPEGNWIQLSQRIN